MKCFLKLPILCLLTFMTSCGVLEQDPISDITLDKAFEGEADMQAAVVGVYNRLAMEVAGGANEMPLRYMYNGEYRADTYISSRVAAYQTARQGNFDSTWPWANWQNYYATLRNINNLLYYGKTIPDSKFTSVQAKNRLVGEGHFLRAFVYFNLVRVWENVVLRTEPILDTKADFEGVQAAPSAVLKQIETDLLEAARLMPREYPSANRGRATRGAAQALLAKYYVYISSPYAQKYLNVDPPQWAKAASWADSVIRTPTLYSLVPGSSYATIFTQNGTSESILEIVYDALITGPNPVNDLTGHFLPRKITVPTGGTLQLQPSDKLIDAFKNLRDTLRFNGAMAEIRVADGWLAADVGKNAPGIVQKYNNHYVKKYPGTIQGTVRNGDSNIIMLRLADVILLRAEALLEAGNVAGAQLELDKITTRAGIAKRTVSVDEVILQRWMELCFEGDRWYDLKRRMLLEKETGTYAAYPKGYLFPIVNGEIANNPNAKQNPGW